MHHEYGRLTLATAGLLYLHALTYLTATAAMIRKSSLDGKLVQATDGLQDARC